MPRALVAICALLSASLSSVTLAIAQGDTGFGIGIGNARWLGEEGEDDEALDAMDAEIQAEVNEVRVMANVTIAIATIAAISNNENLDERMEKVFSRSVLNAGEVLAGS